MELGELPCATSAVMEMCIDNPREGFSNIFDTHPPVDARVAALVKFAGGHDPGPLALPAPGDTEASETGGAEQPAPAGPWGGSQPAAGGEPFLPSRPPVELGSSPSARAQPLGTAPEIASRLVQCRQRCGVNNPSKWP
jgi:heat shock protein HtpX